MVRQHRRVARAAARAVGCSVVKLQWGQWSLEWRARNSSSIACLRCATLQQPRVVVRRAVVLCPVRDGQAQLLLVGQDCCSMLTTMKLTAAVFQPRQRIVGKAELELLLPSSSSSAGKPVVHDRLTHRPFSSPRATPQRCLLYWQRLDGRTTDGGGNEKYWSREYSILHPNHEQRSFSLARKTAPLCFCTPLFLLSLGYVT